MKNLEAIGHANDQKTIIVICLNRENQSSMKLLMILVTNKHIIKALFPAAFDFIV
jgi:hypothetical protein